MSGMDCGGLCRFYNTADSHLTDSASPPTLEPHQPNKEHAMNGIDSELNPVDDEIEAIRAAVISEGRQPLTYAEAAALHRVGVRAL